MYHLSFTGLFHAENGHGVNADIVRKTPYGKVEYLGRSAADINEISTFFSSGIFPLCITVKNESKDYHTKLKFECA